MPCEFPVTFVNHSGDYDFISPVVNFTGNALIVAVAGMSLAAISYLALSASGNAHFLPVLTFTAVPAAIGVMGAVGTFIGGACILYIGAAFAQAMGRR